MVIYRSQFICILFRVLVISFTYHVKLKNRFRIISFEIIIILLMFHLASLWALRPRATIFITPSGVCHPSTCNCTADPDRTAANTQPLASSVKRLSPTTSTETRLPATWLQAAYQNIPPTQPHNRKITTFI